jgi:phage terminase small subunit
MPVLPNPRHERFAQELAKGKSAAEAYELAGYKPNRGNASVLKQQESILSRVSELLAAREKIEERATEKAVEKTAITKAWIIEQLVDNVREAKQNGQTGPANRALELLGKELGMFIDRKEVGKPGDFDNMTPDELAEYVRRETEALGFGDGKQQTTH